MAAPRFGKTAHQHAFFCLHKQYFDLMAFIAQVLDLLLRFLNVDAGADIDTHAEFGFIGAFDVVQHQRRQHFQRQVVHAEIAEVFELFEGNGLTRAGQSANQDDFHGFVRFL